MAKKKKKKKKKGPPNHASHLRRGYKTAKDVMAYVKILEECVGEMKALSRSMKDNNLDKVRLDGVMKLDRALVQTNGFLKHLEFSVNEAM